MNPPVAVIYHILDPRNGKPIYVGQTVDTVSRKRGHMTGRHSNRSRSPFSKWVGEMQSLGLTPEMVVAKTVPEHEATQAERAEIQRLRAAGFSLLNKIKPASAGLRRGWAVECIETGEVFPSYSRAARAHGVSGTTISNRCRDGESIIGGWHFREVC